MIPRALVVAVNRYERALKTEARSIADLRVAALAQAKVARLAVEFVKEVKGRKAKKTKPPLRPHDHFYSCPCDECVAYRKAWSLKR